MKKSMFCTVFALMMSVFVVTAVYADSYNLNNRKNTGYQWGNYHNLPSNIRDNGGEVEILDVSFGIDVETIIGCGGIDLKSAFTSLIDSLDPDQIAQQIEDYFTTGLANYLLTQVYSSPALAAIFDSLEAFGNARVSMMQQKCMSYPELREAGAELAAARAKEDCIANTHPEERHKCFEDGSSEMADAVSAQNDKTEEDRNLASSLYSLLNLDPSKKDSKKLALTNFLPDFKFCVNSESRCSYDDYNNKKPDISAAESHTMAETAVMAQLESLKATMAGVIYANGLDFVKNYAEQYFFSASNEYDSLEFMVSDIEERSFLNPFISDIRLNVINFAAGAGDDKYTNTAPEYNSNKYPAGWEEFAKIMPSEVDTDDEREFVVFINCRSSDLGLETVNFIEAMVPAIVPAVSEIMSGGKVVSASYTQLLEDYQDGNASDADAIFLQGVELIGIATACAYNHSMHMHPIDFIDLVEMGNSKADTILAAVADQVASLAVESILRFTKEKILEKIIGKTQVVSGSDKTLKPMDPADIMTLEAVIKSIENKIDTLVATRDAKKSFSQMMTDIHTAEAIRASNAPENRRR